jgi:hypothetical protein
MSPLVACMACVVGVVMVVTALVPAPAPIDPIPLPRAAIATPVRFPTVPPIRATPAFVSTDKQPAFLPDHRGMLMRWYIPERPESAAHMGH